MFLVGEFSKISRVSKRLLHHYDDIGLMKPAHIDPQTGYRYYSARQLPRLNRILALKDLGLSLDQIIKLLQGYISDAEIQGMLLLKKAETEQAVSEELQRLHQIEARLYQNQMMDDPLDVVVKSIPAQPFLSARTVFATPEETLQRVEQILHTIPASVSPGVLGAFAGVVYTEGFSLTDNDIDLGYLLKKPFEEPISLTEACALSMHNLPAVETMATTVQVGSPDPVLVALGKIAQWIEANGYRIVGPYRELAFDVSSLDDLEQAVYEIQIPVERAPNFLSISAKG